MKASSLPILLLALLAGCSQDHGAGVSAEMTDSNSQDSKNVLSRIKDMVVGTSAKATVKMPATGLIADAMLELLDQDLQDIEGIKNAFYKGAKYDHWTPLVEVPDINLSGVRNWPDVIAGFDKKLANNPISPETLLAKRACAEKGSNGDLGGAKACYKEYFRAVISAATVVIAHSPERGWPIDPKSKSIGGYMISMSNTAEFANLLETELSASLQGRALRDPAEAKTQIRVALFSMKPDTLDKIAEQAQSTAIANLKHPTIDMASGKGITWSATGSTYSNMGTGWTIAKNGMTWFGDGKVNGKAYELALESSVSANMTKRQSTDSTTSSTSSDQQKADTKVK